MNYIEYTGADDSRILSDSETERVVERIKSSFGKPDGDVLWITVSSLWLGGQRWARNRALMNSDLRQTLVTIQYQKDRGHFGLIFNQIDDASLRAASECVKEGIAKRSRPGYDFRLEPAFLPRKFDSKGIPVWSDVSFNRKGADNARLVIDLADQSESQGMLSAGTIVTGGGHHRGYHRDEWGRERREVGSATNAECSVTVRHPKGVGSGWAGESSFDLSRLDLHRLGKIAFDKCISSVDSVRIEPGRYQTILEPPAVASFAHLMVRLFSRGPTETAVPPEYAHPFGLGYDSSIDLGRSKLGLPVLDRRLNIFHDPENSVYGTHPNPGMQRVDYITKGVLTGLSYGSKGSIVAFGQQEFLDHRESIVVQGTETMGMDEMISSMKRGLILTRVDGLKPLDERSSLYTGVTRDGLWLIEDGKISKPVRNFRWTESPLFIFNNVESIGESVPTFTSWYDGIPFRRFDLQNTVNSIVVPPMKINDFSFTSTIDAI